MNKVVKHLRDEAFIEAHPMGDFGCVTHSNYCLPGEMLTVLTDTNAATILPCCKEKQLRDALSKLDLDAGGFAAYAAFSAADLQAPHVRQPKTWIYVDDEYIKRFEELTEAKRVESGENIIVLIPMTLESSTKPWARSLEISYGSHKSGPDLRRPFPLRKSRRRSSRCTTRTEAQTRLESVQATMNGAPRHQSEYNSRQTEAARRVLVDLGQVLAAFHDCFVVVGGWVPDLLISEVKETHVGSIDVDLALDAEKLNDGRYAELLKLLLDTRRYRLGVKPFQLLTDVDLQDGHKPIQVDVEFLAPKRSN